MTDGMQLPKQKKGHHRQHVTHD